jgi:hypothetical protein
MGQLKKIKRKHPELQIVFSDVIEAPKGFHLIKDQHSCKGCAKPSDGSESDGKPSNFCYLNPTIRLLRFGKLFNERTSSIHNVGSENEMISPALQMQLE